VNGSPSTTSPGWPTNWPADSFRNVWTWVLLGAFVIVLGFVIALSFALAPQLAHVSSSQVNRPVFIAGLATQAFFEAGAVAIVLAALPRLSKLSLRELGFRTPSASTLAIAVGGALAMTVVANGLATLIDTVLHSKHEQDAVQILQMLRDPVTLGVFIVYAVVLAPFFEESLFRIFVFNVGLRFGGFWAGAIASGVLFGLAHGDLYAAVPLALGGMILCYVYYRTRNAWASMISHGLFNAISILGLLLAPGLFAN